LCSYDSFRTAAGAKLAEDTMHVYFGGGFANNKPLSYFPVAAAIGEQRENFAFPRGKAERGVAVIVQVEPYPGGEIAVAALNEHALERGSKPLHLGKAI
jgi:hypothetical protein